MSYSLDKFVSVWLKGFKKRFPKLVRRRLRHYVPRFLRTPPSWRASERYSNIQQVSSCPAKVNVTLGIIKDYYCLHEQFISACRDLGVPYRLIDIYGADWIEVIQNSGCDAFVVTPRLFNTAWRFMYDERLKVMTEDLGVTLYPSYNELWMYESKRRMHYWLESHGFAHPKTWIFYSYDKAIDFAKKVDLPVVAKTDAGYSAYGVKILQKRSDVIKYVNQCFKKGVVTDIGGFVSTERSSVFFQKYIPDAKEWRMIRIGESYFGRQKRKVGQFHSGFGEIAWYDPPDKLLELIRELTESGGFTSMNADIFETTDGRYLVNELQSLFGSKRPYDMLLNGKSGRYFYDANTKLWRFEEGVFGQNQCCNLRVQTVVQMLGHHVELPVVDAEALVSESDREASIRDYHKQMSK